MTKQEITSEFISGIKDRIDFIKKTKQQNSLKNANSELDNIDVSRDMLNHFKRSKHNSEYSHI